MSIPGSRRPFLYEIAGAGLGAALGWLLAPLGDQRLGMAIGGGVGALVGGVCRGWWLGRRPVSENPLALGRLGQAGYVIGFVFCLAALSFPIRSWLEHPEKWLVALAGLLFFGSGAVALVLLWQADRQVISRGAREARRTVVLGICSVLLGLASVLLAVVDNSAIGIGLLGALFFGLGGAVLIWRGLLANQSDSG